MSKTKQAAIEVANENGNHGIVPGAWHGGGPGTFADPMGEETQDSECLDDLPDDPFDQAEEAAF